MILSALRKLPLSSVFVLSDGVHLLKTKWRESNASFFNFYQRFFDSPNSFMVQYTKRSNIMGKSKTPTFILELAIVSSPHDEAELNARFEAARQLYNACLDEAKRRLDLLRQSNEFQHAKRYPKTVDGKRNKGRTEAFKELNAKFGFSEYSIIIHATTIRNSWISNHIDANTARSEAEGRSGFSQKLASRAFKAVQKVAFGQAKRVRFKGKNQLKSVEGATNRTGIRYISNTGHIEWKGLKLKCIIDVNDEVVVHGLSHRVKYCRIIKRIFNGKERFFVQLALEGNPLIKEKNKPADNIVGLDIGPSTIAVVTDKQASLERFCDELKKKQKEIRRLQRKLDRQRRANNPQNYNPNGTIKKGKKTWHESTRYKKTRRKLAELQRKLAAHRKTLHGKLANRIVSLGKHIKTEKLSYRAFQKNFSRSVRDRAPGMFMEILRRKAENEKMSAKPSSFGGSVDEFSTRTTKLSQYCHKCKKYTKKPLSQRVHTCCDLNIQRDIYSEKPLRLSASLRAFLAVSVVENSGKSTSRFTLDTADVSERWRSTEAVLLRAVSRFNQVANGRHLPSYFGMVNPLVDPTRDRAARLRSSDAQHQKSEERGLACSPGMLDTEDRDVVAEQLRLF